MKHHLAQIHNPALPEGIGGAAGDDGAVAIATVMGNLYQTVVMVGGLALLLYLAWGGINWITAGGDKGKIDDAKNKITNAIVGMGILVAVVAIINLLTGVFGIDILNPTVPEPLPAVQELTAPPPVQGV